MADAARRQETLRSALGRVRGLGSAHAGVAHWVAQRLTAVALLPLTLWFVVSIVGMLGASQAEVRAWIASPLASVLLLLLVAATFHHLSLGLQVVIEDYVHHEEAKLAAQIAQKFACVLLGVAGCLSILRIAL
ncbi:MAG: succinate dehydrogenase, hydrophobic membrane anchor protein [Acetobacteraceae bacterium]|nr:succinate dehydrogenase, hydrophobic membrane anchor protein [Acetobacteraceae bacterium]